MFLENYTWGVWGGVRVRTRSQHLKCEGPERRQLWTWFSLAQYVLCVGTQMRWHHVRAEHNLQVPWGGTSATARLPTD